MNLNARGYDARASRERRATLDTLASVYTPKPAAYSDGYWDGYHDASWGVARVPVSAASLAGGYVDGYHRGQAAYRIDKGTTE